MDIISHLGTTPLTLNALGKLTGLSQTQLALGLVELGGRVKVQDGGIILAPEPTKPARKTGPRGSIARTAPRHQLARDTLLKLAGAGTTNALEVLAAADGGCNYADIIKVAREMVEAGTITESKKGRKCSWTLPSAE